MPLRINIPPVTRALLIALVTQSFLSAAIRYRQWTADAEVVVPYLTLVPQLSLAYPWVFLTTTLVESNIFTLAISTVTLYQGGRYLERAWSSAELAKFIVVSSLIPNVLCCGTLVMLLALTGSESWTLTVVSGTVPLQMSFLVAFSQLVPAHTVTIFKGIVSLRVPRFPLLYLGAVATLALTPLLTSASPLLAAYALVASWTYLRFHKKVFPDLDASQPAGLRGDASDTFAFAEFFPRPAKPAVAAVSDAVFSVLVSVGVCTPFSAADVAAATRAGGGGDNTFLHHRGAPGSARAEADRRRALALKALDQRLNAATAKPAPAAAAQAQPQPPKSPSGPTVQTQPAASSQSAMTTQPGGAMSKADGVD